jgi:hypothetical protein
MRSMRNKKKECPKVLQVLIICSKIIINTIMRQKFKSYLVIIIRIIFEESKRNKWERKEKQNE